MSRKGHARVHKILDGLRRDPHVSSEDLSFLETWAELSEGLLSAIVRGDIEPHHLDERGKPCGVCEGAGCLSDHLEGVKR